MLGHSSIRTTQIYSKVKQKKVAAEMKFFLMSQQLMISRVVNDLYTFFLDGKLTV